MTVEARGDSGKRAALYPSKRSLFGCQPWQQVSYPVKEKPECLEGICRSIQPGIASSKDNRFREISLGRVPS